MVGECEPHHFSVDAEIAESSTGLEGHDRGALHEALGCRPERSRSLDPPLQRTQCAGDRRSAERTPADLARGRRVGADRQGARTSRTRRTLSACQHARGFPGPHRLTRGGGTIDTCSNSFFSPWPAKSRPSSRAAESFRTHARYWVAGLRPAMVSYGI